jgi:hypothetical protein
MKYAYKILVGKSEEKIGKIILKRTLKEDGENA